MPGTTRILPLKLLLRYGRMLNVPGSPLVKTQTSPCSSLSATKLPVCLEVGADLVPLRSRGRQTEKPAASGDKPAAVDDAARLRGQLIPGAGSGSDYVQNMFIVNHIQSFRPASVIFS